MTSQADSHDLDETAIIARDLIRFDTTNYGDGRSNGEADAAEYVAAKLSELGLKPQLFESESGRVSVVARVEGRNEGSAGGGGFAEGGFVHDGFDTAASRPTQPATGPTQPATGPTRFETEVTRLATGATRQAGKAALVVHGHLDVVPAIADSWSVDPFAGTIKDGMLWGRGAVDMKNMDAMILTALQDILGAGKQPARDLVIAFFADEEAGGVLGSHYLVDTHPELFADATEAISEVGGYSITLNDKQHDKQAGDQDANHDAKRAYLIQTGEKAMLWIKLIARGEAAHGSRLIPNNAVTKLAEAVATIGRREWPIRLTMTTAELLTEVASILGADPQLVGPDEIAIATGTAAGFILASLRTTSNPTQLTAGYKHNVIPDTAEALIDVRTLPGEEEAVLAEIEQLVGDDIEVIILHQDIGLETPFSGPLIDAITTTLHTHDPGAFVLPYLLSGGTDNKALSRLGIKGYGFAPLRLPAAFDFPGMFHGVDERVPLDALVFGRQVLTDLLLNY